MVGYQLFSEQVAASVSNFSPKQVPLWCALPLFWHNEMSSIFLPLAQCSFVLPWHPCLGGGWGGGLWRAEGWKREDTYITWLLKYNTKTFPSCSVARFRPRCTGQRGNWRDGVRAAISTQTWQKIVRRRQLHLPSALRQFLQLIASVWAVFELLILPCKICMIPWISIILGWKTFSETGSCDSPHVKEWEILFLMALLHHLLLIYNEGQILHEMSL